MDGPAADLLAGCHGALPLGELVELLAIAHDRPTDALVAATLPAVREFVRHGLLGARGRGRVAVRAVAARVAEASVRVDGAVVGAIAGPGLLVLLGVHRDDTAAAAPVMARKLHELRILDGERSCAELGAPLLVVSQFTLYGDTRKGRRPTWQAAAPPAVAEPLVDAVVAELRARGATVATGVFGAEMAVASVNDGPFTVLVEV